MESSATAVKKEFLHTDENVKFSFSVDDKNLTINCDHPIFKNRFNGNSATLDIHSLFTDISKGSKDYDFFEKMRISLQEYFIDHGTE